MNFSLNKHELIHASDAGGGYHGYCKHCSKPLVTDLGFCSWDNTECINRIPDSIEDFPKEIQSYVHFNGLFFNVETQMFHKPFSNNMFSYSDILKKIEKVKKLV